MFARALLLSLSLFVASPSRAEAGFPSIRGVVHDIVERQSENDLVAVDARERNEGKKKASKEASVGGGGGFHDGNLKGRFSYFNTAGDVASIAVGVFDGAGTVVAFEDFEANVPDGAGGRIEKTIEFDSGYYEIHPSGRGKIYLRIGEPGDWGYDPPYELELVITATGEDGEIAAMDSFQVPSQAGFASQLVAPRWTKIADE